MRNIFVAYVGDVDRGWCRLSLCREGDAGMGITAIFVF